MLTVCWPSSGFFDPDSGVYRIEWQLARWTGLAWDTLTGTQQLSDTETAAVLSSGVLNLTKADLYAVIGNDFLTHPNRLRIGVRAMNRAGMRSCSECPSLPCTCAHNAMGDEAFYAPWVS